MFAGGRLFQVLDRDRERRTQREVSFGSASEILVAGCWTCREPKGNKATSKMGEYLREAKDKTCGKTEGT